ncbi:hypothetical protein C8Q75DRAFT_354399 [Abortiporus biennis]|nr:hypothetical protein C8Q75DRAFT_354399 [Abortiporus biennis]
MPYPSLRRSTSLQITLPSPSTGTLRLSTSQNPLKRKLSELTDATPAPQIIMSTPTDETYNSPPSPVPTEIIDNEPEDYIRTAKQHGVKVRDFAYEARLKPYVTEVWTNPISTLAKFDAAVRKPYTTSSLSGRDLHRLMEIGWLTNEEANKYLTDIHWDRIQDYRSKRDGPYPYILCPHTARPTRAARKAARIALFGAPEPKDLADDLIEMPPDEPGMWDGLFEGRMMFEVDEEDEEEAHRDKRQKLDSKTFVPRLTRSKQKQRSRPSRESPSPVASSSSTLERTSSVTNAFPPTSTPPPSQTDSRKTRSGLQRSQTQTIVSVR